MLLNNLRLCRQQFEYLCEKKTFVAQNSVVFPISRKQQEVYPFVVGKSCGSLFSECFKMFLKKFSSQVEAIAINIYDGRVCINALSKNPNFALVLKGRFNYREAFGLKKYKFEIQKQEIICPVLRSKKKNQIMDIYKLKEKLETITCHIHGDAAYITVSEDNTMEIETCCLLFRHQLLLMSAKHEERINGVEATA